MRALFPHLPRRAPPAACALTVGAVLLTAPATAEAPPAPSVSASLSAAAPAPGRTRLSVRVTHSPQLHPRGGRAWWSVAPSGGRRFAPAAATPLREIAPGSAVAAATVSPPSRSFSFRVCLDPGWGPAMGPAGAPARRCRGGDLDARPGSPRPLEFEGRARGIPLAPYPSGPSIAAAARLLATRAGRTAFAIVDSTGRLAGAREHEHFQSASVVKVMMLIAYLQLLDRHHRALHAADAALLGPMIHISDNDAASRVLAIIGRRGLASVARQAGMSDYAPAAGWWAFTQTSAADQARLMFALGRLIPGEFYPYARGLLSGIEPSQSWGIPPVARPRWQIFFKTGALPSEGLFNEVARLERPGVGFSVAVLTTGDPSMAYGEQTIAGVGAALLAREPF